MATFSISSNYALEGDYIVFDVTLSEPVIDAVTVDYRARSGTAFSGTDFYESGGDGAGGQLVFLAGETSKTLRFYAVGDSADELDEAFAVELTNPFGADFAGANRSLLATGWVLDADGPGANRSIAVSGPIVVEGTAATAAFTVSLSTAFTTATTLAFSTFDGSALAGSDYVARSGSIAFAAGQTEATVLVSLINDGVAEAAESFGLRVAGSGTTLGAAGAAGVLDTDAAVPALSIEGGRANEGQYLTFVVRLSEPADDAVTVDYRARSGTALSGTDFYESGGDGAGEALTFLAGETSKTLRFYATGDGADEFDENFAVELTNPLGAAFGGANRSLQATGSILDLDGPGANRAIAVSQPVMIEGARATAAFSVSLSSAFTTATTLTYSTFDGSAVAGEDYVAKSGAIVFAAGQTEATVLVDLVNDRTAEAAASFGLRVAGAGTTPGATGAAVILDTDAAVPALSIEGGRANEGDYLTFVVRLSQPAADDVTLDYRAVSGTALIGTDFYESGGDGAGGALTFLAGETSKTLRYYVTGDAIDERDETFAVELTNPVGAAFGAANRSLHATGSILDLDGPGANRALAISQPVMVEGSGATAAFTVSLSSAFATATTLAYSTFDGSALAGDDYEAKSGSITFAAGQTEATVLVDLINDGVAEAAESFGLRIAGSGTVLGATGAATVLDIDAAAPALSIEGNRASEGGYLTFVVRLSEPAADDVTVGYRAVPGAALAGSDFYASGGDGANGALTFLAGETSKTLRFYAPGDAADELDENFAVELFDPVGAGFGPANATWTATGWVLDADGPGLNRAVAVGSPTVNERVTEGARTAVFDIELSQAATTRLVFDYETLDGSAVAGRDYAAQSGRVVFEVGQTRASVAVDLLSDVAREGAETFSLRLETPFPTAISQSLTAAIGTTTIIDGSFVGTPGNDRITGSSVADGIYGGGGDDALFGVEGADYIYGGTGADRLYGGEGIDRLYGGSGDDILQGGSGTDRMEGGAGDDTYIVDVATDRVVEARGAGDDTVQTPVAYTLSATVENLTLTGSGFIRGTGNSLANTIRGNAGGNVLTGAAGNDKLYGGLGEDWLNGGAGNDKLYGGLGENWLNGGAGHDLLNGGLGTDEMAGGSGNDTYVVLSRGDNVREDEESGRDTIQSSVVYALDDHVENLTLTGDANVAGTGNRLDNVLRGNDGNNLLNAVGGDDRMLGGDGRDRLMGGDGIDVMTGGAGADRFVFQTDDTGRGAKRDTVTDFDRGPDHIDLTEFDANARRGDIQAFNFIGADAFSDRAGELRFSREILSGDTDGDGRSDFEIALTDIARLSAGDLLI